MTTENTQLATIDNEPTARQLLCSLDMSTDEGKDTALYMFNAAESLADVPEGQPLQVIGLVLVPGSRRPRDGGAPQPCTNTYVLCQDGSCYMSQSAGVADSAEKVLLAYPDCKADRGGMTMCVMSRALRNGNTIKRLVPVR